MASFGFFTGNPNLGSQRRAEEVMDRVNRSLNLLREGGPTEESFSNNKCVDPNKPVIKHHVFPNTTRFQPSDDFLNDDMSGLEGVDFVAADSQQKDESDTDDPEAVAAAEAEAKAARMKKGRAKKLRKRRYKALKSLKLQAEQYISTNAQMVWKQLNKAEEEKREEGPNATNEPNCKMLKSADGGDEIDDDSANPMETAEENETTPAVFGLGLEEQCSDGAKHVEDIEDDLFEQNTGLEELKSPDDAQDTSVKPDLGIEPSKAFLTCFVCKFRTFYKETMNEHLNSRFHKEHFRFLTEHFPEPAVNFLQKIITNKQKMTEQYIDQIPNYRAAICKVYEKWDLTREVGLEHFLKRTHAAHCMSCDIYIPMRRYLIQKHLKSSEHKHNSQVMMEKCKQRSLSIAQSILGRKATRRKLKRHLMTPEAWATGQWVDSDPEADKMNEVVKPICGLANQAEEGVGKDQEAEPSSKGMVQAIKEGPAEGRSENVQEKREGGKESFFGLLDDDEDDEDEEDDDDDDDDDDDVEGVELGEEELEENDFF